MPGRGQRVFHLCFEARWAERSAESIWFTEKWHLSGYLQSFKRSHSAFLALSKPGHQALVYGASLQGSRLLWLCTLILEASDFLWLLTKLFWEHCPSSFWCRLGSNQVRWSVSQAGPTHAILHTDDTQTPVSVALISIPKASWRYIVLLHIPAFSSFPGPPTHLSIQSCTHLPIYLSIHLLTHQFIHLSIHLPTYPPPSPSTYPNHLLTFSSDYPPTHSSNHL